LSDSVLFVSGGLFTTDFLVEGVREFASYRDLDTERLRAGLAKIAHEFPRAHKPNESQTEDDFIWKVLGELGWSDFLRQQNLTAVGREDVPDGLLFADSHAKTQANSLAEEYRRYGHGLAVVESKRWGRPLDRAGRGDEAATPSTQMLRYLRRIDDLTHGRLRWGILTNGGRWRLYWAGARSVSEEFLEIDLARVLGLHGDLLDEGVTEIERDHWLRVFAVLFEKAAFIPADGSGNTFHAIALKQSAFYEERVARDLSAVVFGQVFPGIASAIRSAAPTAGLQDVREASLVLLYRLLFLLYAEDRDLLPVRDRRYDDYALRPLRQTVGARVSEGDVFSTSATAIWSRISDLSRMIDKGDPSVGLPPYNGGLFASEATPLLDTIRIGDATMAMALDALSFERSTGLRRYINYRDLSVQQLGSIYERLLEFEIVQSEDGGLSVRPNLFARKNTGSYYTPDELVGLILDQTLAPLVGERLAAFRATLVQLEGEMDEGSRRRELKRVDPAEAILGLRVCDPAMGSGHFLVRLVDILADHVLDAMAEAAVAGAPFGYRSPLAERIEAIRDTILANAVAANWAIDEAQLDDRHIVRRMVLKRCVYGVDKNPMAVELAKVALWLHTFTVGAPLSFIDHHLRTGDSLFGLWLRQAIDKASARGGGDLLYSSALREAQSAASAMQIIERLTDAEIAEAHRSAETFFGIKSQTAPLDAFASFLHALDWLDLKGKENRTAIRAWLDGIFGNPIDIALGRAVLTADALNRSHGARFQSILERARGLIKEERFLNWQISFPGVWDDWERDDRKGGFDAVVGNPPWDPFEFEEVPWFSARAPDIALETSGARRKARITKLQRDQDPLWADFRRASDQVAMASKVVRSGGNYEHLNSGKLNIYKVFVERAFQLLKPDGMLGLLVPSGIGSDQSSSDFFRKISGENRLKSMIDFFNRRSDGTLFFPDVYYRFKFCAYVAGGTARTFDSAQYGFFIRDIAEISDSNRVFPISAREIEAISPNSGTAPIFRSRRDKEITSAIYGRVPVLVDRSGGTPVTEWPVTFGQMINMASDSASFRDADELAAREAAWPTANNRFESAEGRWLPLYEGKMVQAFDHRASDIVLAAENVFRPGQGSDLSEAEHQDPARFPRPRFWILEANVPWASKLEWSIGLKDVTSSTNARTTIATIIPKVGAGHTLPVLMPSRGPTDAESAARERRYVDTAPLLVANLNCVILDYLARQKVHGNHLAWYLLEQLPVISRSAYCRRFGPKTAEEIVRSTVLELSYTAQDLSEFARDMTYFDDKGELQKPCTWDEDRRFHLRAKLDALYFILYGIYDAAHPECSRDDVQYIFSTFPVVERDELAAFGFFRSRDLTLSYLNALSSGQPDAVIAA
jgi:hypothetical protein